MWRIRYKPDSDLSRRFPDKFSIPGATYLYATRKDAEEIRRVCVNASEMETVEVEG